jgi:hypothetical protein
MTKMASSPLSKEEVLALRGLRLPSLALKRLRQVGIYCDSSVSIQHQSHAQQYVIRGVESGGSIQEMGAYCSFVGIDGNPLWWLQQIQSVGRNGLHAVVVASELLRLQMFRNEQTYQLLITRHRLEAVQGSKRPMLVNTVVFHGINGTPAPHLDETDSPSSARQSPVFRTRSGEILPVPAELRWAVQEIAAASNCLGCKHCHLLRGEQLRQTGEPTEVLSI